MHLCPQPDYSYHQAATGRYTRTDEITPHLRDRETENMSCDKENNDHDQSLNSASDFPSASEPDFEDGLSDYIERTYVEQV